MQLIHFNENEGTVLNVLDVGELSGEQEGLIRTILKWLNQILFTSYSRVTLCNGVHHTYQYGKNVIIFY